MTPALTGPSHPPASGAAPRQLVVLLHGLGADGDDLIGLAPALASALPDAEFLSPHAPFACDMAPYGRQWFSLQDRSYPAMLSGVRQAAPHLDAFLDKALAARGLSAGNLALLGFSQGTMMSLYVAPRRKEAVAAVIGFSGALLGAETLVLGGIVRPPVLLVHGEADPVVPFAAMGMAEMGLRAAGVPVETVARPGLPHSIDEEGLAAAARFLVRAFSPPS